LILSLSLGSCIFFLSKMILASLAGIFWVVSTAGAASPSRDGALHRIIVTQHSDLVAESDGAHEPERSIPSHRKALFRSAAPDSSISDVQVSAILPIAGESHNAWELVPLEELGVAGEGADSSVASRSNLMARSSWRVPAPRSRDWLTLLTAWSPALASLTFLTPALMAARHRRCWHAALFAATAIVGMVHNHCEAMAGHEMKSLDVGHCSNAFQSSAAYIARCLGHLCFLQAGFFVLGPEDPTIIWNMPCSVSALVRIIPATVLIVGLRPSATTHFAGVDHDAWWSSPSLFFRGAVLDSMLLCWVTLAFWVHQQKMSRATDMLLRARFWRRAVRHFLLPSLALLPCIVATEFLGVTCLQAWLRAVCQVGIAAMVTAALWTVLAWDTQLLDRSSTNPIVAEQLLFCLAGTGLPTLALSLLSDWVLQGCHGRWPTLATAAAITSNSQRSLVLAVGFPPTLLAIVTTFWIIESAPALTTRSSRWSLTPIGRPFGWSRVAQIPLMTLWPSFCLWFGCRIAYAIAVLGLFLGLLKALSIDSGQFCPSLCVVFAMILPIGMSSAIVLCSVACDLWSTTLGRLRAALAAAIFVCSAVFLVLFALNRHLVPNAYGDTLAEQSTSSVVCALAEYATYVLSAAWPLTWAQDVQTPVSSHLDSAGKSYLSDSSGNSELAKPMPPASYTIGSSTNWRFWAKAG